MIKKEFTIASKEGLHARPASLLCQLASEYADRVDIEFNNIVNTAKSIMVVMSLGIAEKDVFSLIIDGPNETTILSNIQTMFQEHELI